MSRVALVAASFLACLGAPRWAHADDASCIAASESEVGLRKQDKLIESLVQLALCAAPACPIEVRSECNRRLVRVNTAMPTLVLRATDDAGNDLLAVTVSLDGAPFATSLTGRATSLNPGSHVLRFEARGKVPLEKTLLVAQGEKDRRIVVTLLDAHAAAPVVVAPAPSPSVAPVPPRPVVPVSPIETPEPPPTSHGDGRRTAAYVLGGVGLGGIVAGGVFGGLAFSKWSSAKGECNGGGSNPCAHNTNSAATNDQQTAGTFADASTGLLIAGGALAATGVVLVLLGRKATPTTGLHWSPTVLAHGGALGLSGAW
jgi:hypothetical protein